MKGVLVIIDGAGDLPNSQLLGKTPLEAAETPNLDYLSEKGELGKMIPVQKDFVPGTSESIISMFGLDWQDYPRGWLEGLGSGIDLKNGDLALRANFATIDNWKNRKVIDRRAGRNLTSREAEKLIYALNKQIKLNAETIIKNTLQHRVVLVFKGGFSDNISNTDPEYTYITGLQKMKLSVPEDDDEITEYSANTLNNFLEQSFNILDNHPVNIERKKKGFFPANILLTRNAGTYLEKIKKFSKWSCASSVPVIKGIAKSLGMELEEYEPVYFKSEDAYKNLRKNLIKDIKRQIKNLKRKLKKKDFSLIYIKEIDSAGHDNKPLEKKQMIETVDKRLFSFLRKFSEKNNLKLIITTDHSTPCKLKKHSSDAVPVLFCDFSANKKKGEKKKPRILEKKRFCEKDAENGNLGKFLSKKLLKLFN